MVDLSFRWLSRSFTLALVVAASACGDDGSSGDDDNASAGSSGAPTSGPGSSSGMPPGGSSSTGPGSGTGGSTDGGPGSSSGNDSTDGGMATDSGGSDTGGGGSDSGSGSGSGGRAAITYADIQLELENANGAFGNYESCTDGASCHQNPARNVHIVPNPTPAQLMTNWSNIVNVPQGVVPWVTPADDTAQMLNEVPIPADVRARWLEWIQNGAPFE